MGSNYVGAPYNFVPFSDKVYSLPAENLIGHNEIREELFTGELDYEIIAQTPIFVDGGTREFHRDPYGKYSIPGSTMRGLIRNNVQILGFCSIGDDIDDYALMYRDVIGGNGSVKDVQAGYIKNENGKYVIYKLQGDKSKRKRTMNYYMLSERKIVENPDAYPFFRKKEKNIMQHEFQNFNRYKKDGRPHYSGKPNRFYVPYWEQISYKVENRKDVTAVGDPGKYGQVGYALSSGKMDEKKVIYIIPKIDMKNEAKIQIPREDIEAFKIDYNKREKSLEQQVDKKFYDKENYKRALERVKKFFDLPKPEDDPKPVFYSESNGRIYFGFTPHLRRFYKHTIKEGISSAHCTSGIDYAKSMFGFSSPDGSYRSKLAFSDAVAMEDPMPNKEEERSCILAEPKPTSFMDYVAGGKSYHADNFKLRGVKQYWLRDTLAEEHKQEENKQTERENQNVGSTLKPLPKDTKFQGKIRFRNLTKEELGLLLWSVRLEEDSWMNVGKGKPYGYGNIKVELGEVRCVDTKLAYASENEFSLNPFLTLDAEQYITCYKDSMKDFLGGKNIEKLSPVWEFFAMKDALSKPDPEKIRYMKIDKPECEYQNRKKTKKPLPTIRKTINPNKGEKK